MDRILKTMDVNQSKQGRSDRDRVRIDGYQTGVEVEEGVEIEIISLEQVVDDNPADAADAGEDVGGGIVTMEIGNGDDAFGWNQQGGVRGGVGGGIDNGISRLCDLTSAMDHSDGNNNTMSHLDQDMNSTDGNHFDFGLEDDLRERLSSAGSGHDDLIKGSTRPSSSRSYVVGGELNVDDRDNNDVFDDEVRITTVFFSSNSSEFAVLLSLPSIVCVLFWLIMMLSNVYRTNT